MSLSKNGSRVIGLCIVAALALMVFGAVGAQAAGEFYIKENEKLLSFTEHGNTEPEPVEGRVDVLGTLTVNGLGIIIGCDEFETVGTTVKAGGTGSGSILFKKCVVNDLEGKLLSKCGAQDSEKKVAGDITTKKVSATVFLHPAPSGAPFVLFKPEAGTVFTTVELTGAECAAKGTYPVEGSTVFSIGTGESLWVLIAATSEALFTEDKLKFGERKATIAGSAEVKLGVGAKLADKEWGAL
jgi:hypothetical protein